MAGVGLGPRPEPGLWMGGPLPFTPTRVLPMSEVAGFGDDSVSCLSSVQFPEYGILPGRGWSFAPG